MAERDPRSVFVAENARIAEAVIKLLAAVGIPAEVAQSGTQTTSDPVTGMTEVPAEEFDIVVTDPAKMDAAKSLLETAETATVVRGIRDRRANRTGNVTALCEECGKSSEWPATAMGTTEVCPYCAKYMDIPDPDDEWSGMDFGAPEEEDEGKE
ncbi:MAG: hypothetical protein L0241_04240 [Planctomycetia bacterium]|nr:hypothetical protein [Planctomycetia bacterium]